MDPLSLGDVEGQISSLIRLELARMGRWEDDDLFQEAWFRLLSRWPRLVCAYDPRRGSWQSWIRQIAHNCMIDLIRRHKHINLLPLTDDELHRLVDHRPTAMTKPDEASLAGEVVHAALNELRNRVAPTNYEVLHLYLIGGLTVQAIAQRFDVPPVKVRKCVERMKTKLKDLVSKRLGSDGSTVEGYHSIHQFNRGGGREKKSEGGEGGKSGAESYSLIGDD